MILFSINLALLTVLFFIVGMIKPKWALFFLNAPTRFLIVAITTVLVMITLTVYGEGVRRAKEEREVKTPVAIEQSVVPVPVPAPAAPATAPSETTPAAPAKKWLP